jgi:hypothetical protein
MHIGVLGICDPTGVPGFSFDAVRCGAQADGEPAARTSPA